MRKLPMAYIFFVGFLAFTLILGSHNLVWAQSATDSGTATDSSTTTTTTTATSSESAGIGGGNASPSTLPESGSSDLIFGLGVGAFLILSGLIGRATLAGVLRD